MDPGPKLRAVFADDEPRARAALRVLLGADADIEVVAECANGHEVLAAVRESEPDLLLLDVQMPGLDGFEVVEELGQAAPVVVFVTAYDHYALRAFDVAAVDYVLKPFDDERFRQALARAKARARGGAPRPQLEHLKIHREGRIDLVDVDAIDWIEAADQYVCLHTREGDHLMRQSMAQLEETLDGERFFRVHRSAIVALDRVRSVESGPGSGGRIRLGEDTWLPVSRSRLAALRARLR